MPLILDDSLIDLWKMYLCKQFQKSPKNQSMMWDRTFVSESSKSLTASLEKAIRRVCSFSYLNWRGYLIRLKLKQILYFKAFFILALNILGIFSCRCNHSRFFSVNLFIVLLLVKDNCFYIFSKYLSLIILFISLLCLSIIIIFGNNF